MITIKEVIIDHKNHIHTYLIQPLLDRILEWIPE